MSDGFKILYTIFIFIAQQHFTFGEKQHEAVGTPYTVAPEVIKGSYDERCDGELVDLIYA